MTAPLPGSVLAAIIGISADAIIAVDRDQRITFFNDGASRIFGYSPDEILGQPIDVLLPAQARKIHHKHVEQFIRAELPARRMGERQEIAGRRKNGEEFPAEAAIARLESNGQFYGSVVLRDITERKLMEARQQFQLEVSELLAASVELPDTLALLGRLWIPMLADLAVVEMEDHADLYHLRAARHPRSAAVVVEPLAVVRGEWLPAAGGDAAALQRVSVVPVSVALAAVPPAHRAAAEAIGPTAALVASLTHRGAVLGRVILFSAGRAGYSAGEQALADDLARRATIALDNARLNDQLQRALRARDDTLSVVSHDLRNPVNAVKMLAGALLQRGSQDRLPDEVREQISVVRSAAQQMDTLIQDLLDVSRAEAGRFGVDTETVSTDALLRDALRTLAPLASDKGVRVVMAWPDTVPDVTVDPERIVQVVSNVVGNAIKFTPTGGTITVTAASRPDAVLVSVTDTGPGVAPDHLPHIFDRYWQSSRRNRGAGLGLPIAKMIIEAHGGRIWVDSPPGGGATFHFTLPL
ncbi:MAG: PAS domain S-box protein [Gemmatimonadota bacterium]|nr:PAS domain S-box protein [Gemmatimonadota bacterium]